MMDWKLQSILSLAGGIIVLIVGAGYKGYSSSDLPSIKESGITFFVGAVFTAILSFMGGFDSWQSELSSLFSSKELITLPSSTIPSSSTADFSGMVNQVSDSMKSVSSWFQSTASSDDKDEMMVGTMPF